MAVGGTTTDGTVGHDCAAEDTGIISEKVASETSYAAGGAGTGFAAGHEATAEGARFVAEDVVVLAEGAGGDIGAVEAVGHVVCAGVAGGVDFDEEVGDAVDADGAVHALEAAKESIGAFEAEGGEVAGVGLRVVSRDADGAHGVGGAVEAVDIY